MCAEMLAESARSATSEVEGLAARLGEDLCAETFATFARWRENAERHRHEVVASIGEASWRKFVDSCAVLENLWQEATLGYGLIAAEKADRE